MVAALIDKKSFFYTISLIKEGQMEKEKAIKEFKRYEEMRMEIYDLFEKKIPKKPDGTYDFEAAKPLEAKEMFDLFFKLDYQARKIRGIAINALGVKPE